MSDPITSLNGNGIVSSIDISSMDIETALLAVQTPRANLLETQMKEQMKTVQDRNRDIEILNQALAQLRRMRPSDADGSAELDSDEQTFLVPKERYPVGSVMYESADPDTGMVVANTTGLLESYGISLPNYGYMTQDEYDQAIPTVTAKIDSLNSSQQMDMLRLQSLTNKRNEAFDLMTNFVKKSQDARSSIVGNMR